MGVRFRKYIALAPGLRLNVSKTGVSLKAGPRGASVNFGRRGTFMNASAPGTGLYAREKLSGGSTVAPRRTSNARDRSTVEVAVRIAVDDEGIVSFTDENGALLDDKIVAAAKKQEAEQIRALMQAKCGEINEQVTSLGEIHTYTPHPTAFPEYSPQSYDAALPVRPTPKQPGILARIFKGIARKVELQNRQAEAAYMRARADWEDGKHAFETEQRRRKTLLGMVREGTPTAMEIFFEEQLEDILWSQETHVSFEISDDGTSIAIDVDLPEIEDLPTRLASVPQRGYKLSIKEMSPTQVQKLYMRHVHGIGFRLIGEAFAALPTIQEITLSGYSQRAEKTTAQVVDEYLYSVRVLREGWQSIDFDNLGALDVVEAFARFELHREMTKTGVFKPIIPFLVRP